MKKKKTKKKLKLSKLTVGALQTKEMVDVRGGYYLEGGGGGGTGYSGACYTNACVYTNACPNNPCKTTYGGCNITGGT